MVESAIEFDIKVEFYAHIDFWMEFYTEVWAQFDLKVDANVVTRRLYQILYRSRRCVEKVTDLEYRHLF